MRAVAQRVSEARVTVGTDVVGNIGTGLVVLVGITHSDGSEEVAWLVDKLVNLRIFNDADGKMNLSLGDAGGDVLVVSQFTLYGDARKGRRPSFVRAAAGPEAKATYDALVEALRGRGVRTETGAFGAAMRVSLVNDGPVTILLDSAKTF